ncbi:hypothetical protein W97_07763 [Coniosporium apollinis CBS 100218]|uniref:Uncharacterized protein n=1 Tax=Coniosporium apollinis (strain CBS 100218) TaxID=1168221 RepID=R7Z2U2_CONA1|nr:uncharacterized protein W97_07763 [Coniosporium apollinis CBS 100218]EON68505.1 hypothetical protein W97_07763 [Coniosporium apollinis CBS 100218]
MRKKLFEDGRIHGIISAGGSGGTALASAVMREALPIGFPKLIVSTVASGDTGPIVGETDITMMYSVVDIAGLNSVLRNVLANAAGAIVGMARAYQAYLKNFSEEGAAEKKRRVGVTMFGVTTPCVDVIRKHLERVYDIEVYVFHATGHGGRAMERLINEGQLDAILDITTTEICDFLLDGNMSAGPNRLEAAASAGIPNILSVGACDMANYGARNTVPERFKDRRLYEHNPMVTLMRTNKDECAKIGEFMVEKLRRYAERKEMVQVWLPTGGVSMIATPGGPFEDREADRALFEMIEEGLKDSAIRVVRDERAINDEGFARDIAEELVRLMDLKKGGGR